MCGKFAVNPPWVTPMKKQFGKPWVWNPCRVRRPSAHFSESAWPPLPVMS